ncbi:MAG: DUF167 family protein [Actinomycetota bacterium]|nr:DUF167 family protein [Actinomycetota bacterium]
MEPIFEQDDGVAVRLHVVPGASSSEVKGRYGDTIKIRVTAPPEGGRANRVIVDLLECVVGGTAEIVKGHTSSSKTVLIRGVDIATVVEVLGG